MKRENMKRYVDWFAIGVVMTSAISAYAASENWKLQFARVSDEYLDQVYLR